MGTELSFTTWQMANNYGRSEGGDPFFWLFTIVEILFEDTYYISVNGRFFLLIVLGDKIFDELANIT
jgi:hypothetical protein